MHPMRWNSGLRVLAALAITHGAQAAQVGEPAGSGPFPAIAETRADLPDHTIYRPLKLPQGALPLYVWGNGGCSGNGLAHQHYLREIASRGYYVIALGKPRDPPPPRAPGAAPPAPPAGAAPRVPGTTPDETRPAQMIEAIDWATRENAREGGELRGHIDLTRIAAGGHSCGGLQAISVSADPRIRTTLVLNSGIFNTPAGPNGVQVNKAHLATLHAPMLYLIGGPKDIAYANANDDVSRITHLPVFHANLDVGHGGTFSQTNGGEWARVSVRWLDWQLKADADASWDFAGPACRLCTDARWTVVQKKLPAPVGPLRTSLYLPVRDGTRLAVHVYRPARDGVPLSGKLPVVFAFTPYRARFWDAQGRLQELASFPRGAVQSMLDRGYVFAVADVRGKGASFGSRRGFQDRTEANDGYDVVQWLASQPWSSGKVGMYGCSYLGGTTVHVASAAPPALKAIFTGASDLDKYAFVRNGGITAQFNTRPDEPLSDDLASVPLDEDRDGTMLKTAVADHARNTPMAPLWYGMPFRDSVSPLTGNKFWEEVGPYTYLQTLKRSGIATYFWSNFEDEPTAQMILAAENLNSRLLLGPGTHCVSPPGFDFDGEVQRYFDQHLRDGPPLTTPRVTWWLDGAEAGRNWHQADRWPGVKAARQRWYLAAGSAATEGGLQQAAPGSATPHFAVNYDLGPPDAFAFWVSTQHGRGLSFTSPALTKPQALVGFPLIHLKLSSDRPEPLLFAYLEQLMPDGKATVLSFGRLAAAYRKTGKAPYDTLGLPFHSGLARDHAPLKPKQQVDLEFALTPASRVIPAGAKLRVVVTGADPRQRNLQEIRLTPPPDIAVVTGRAGSWVELPLRSVEGL